VKLPLTIAKTRVFTDAGIFVIFVTDLGGMGRVVTFLMDIYSMLILEPCDSVTKMTEIAIPPKNPLYSIRNAVSWSLFLSQTLVTECDRIPVKPSGHFVCS